MRMKLMAPALTGALLLTGCATSADPSKGGFLSGVQGLTSGTYEQRLSERQKSLEDVQDQAVQRQREVDRLAAQQAEVARRRTESEIQLASLNQDIDRLRTRLVSARRDNSKLEEQVNSLERRINLAEKNPYLDEAEKTRQLQALRREKEQLEKEIELAITR